VRNTRRAAPLLLLLALCPAAQAQENPGEQGRLAAAIRQRIQAIEAARRADLAERAARKDELERLDAAIAGLTQQRDQASDATGLLQRRLDRAEAEGKERVARAERHLAALRAWAEAAQPVALRLGGAARKGIPHRRAARTEAFEGAAELLASDAGDGERAAEGLRRFLAAAALEMQLAATRELKSETVDLGAGVAKHAYVARFGLVNEVFVTEDGTCAGFASRQEASPWRIASSPSERERITAVLDGVRKRRPPELVAVPFVVGRER